MTRTCPHRCGVVIGGADEQLLLNRHLRYDHGGHRPGRSGTVLAVLVVAAAFATALCMLAYAVSPRAGLVLAVAFTLAATALHVCSAVDDRTQVR